MGLEGLLRLIGKKKEAEGSFPEPVGNDAYITTFLEPPCLALYGYILLTLAIWWGWAIRRSVSHYFLRKRTQPSRPSSKKGSLEEPLLRRRPEKPDPMESTRQSLTDEQGRVVTFEGFVYDPLGSLAARLMPMTTWVILLLFGITLYDYYSGCDWRWPDQLCYVGTFPISGSFEVNSRFFLVLWAVGTSWFGMLIWGSGGQMANLFRLHASLKDSTHVHVMVHERVDTISSGFSRTMDAWGKLGGKITGVLQGLFGSALPVGFLGLSGGSSQTVLKSFDPSVGFHFVEFRCVRYVLDPNAGGFTKYNPSQALAGGHAKFLKILEAGGLKSGKASPGETMPRVEDMFRCAGPNKIPFEVDTFLTGMVEEFATYFFLYQLAVYAVCVWFSYWHYTLIALTIALSSGIFNVIIRISSQKAIKSMMVQSQEVTVKRDGKEVNVDLSLVVPGDIVKVGANNWSVPCDLLLLQGAAVCDESTLTGESMPVQRLSPVETLPEAERMPAKHVLVAGTTVLQSTADCWAMATHTGVNTQKGQLLLMILFPPKLLFKYDEQLVVVFFLMINYALVIMAATMATLYYKHAAKQNISITSSWANAIFTCSCVLPSTLRMVLNIGQIVAAQRLQGEQFNIFCAAPKRIPLAGKVRAVCFDKTGTLTESSLLFFGVHCMKSLAGGTAGQGPFAGVGDGSGEAVFEEAPRRSEWELGVLCALASAHSLSPFSGSKAGVVGNAVEVNMFQATGWSLDAEDPCRVRSPKVSGKSEHELKLLRRFDFSHSTMTMSAVVEHLPSGQRGIYCKGSFEQVKQRCIPSSVPADFVSVAERHASTGMYVLAVAVRPYPEGAGPDAENMTREDAEKELVMLGLLLFKNPLRPDTHDTIERLRKGDVRTVMITGDAAGTAICIGKEASLVEKDMPVLLGDCVPGPDKKKGEVVWSCQVEDMTAMNELLLSNDWLTWRRKYKEWRSGGGQGARGEASAHGLGRAPIRERCATWPSPEADDTEAKEEEQPAEGVSFSTEELVLSRLFEWCELAVTQRAFEWLQETQCSADLRRVLVGSRQAVLKKGKALSSGKGDSSLAWELLTSIRIFARMTPGGKVSVVEGLMSQGVMCAMVGDGGNDSGALRTAHVGLALSNATSATVVAPFTTNRPSVAPVVDLLREGRAALATSFAGYKFNIHTGLRNSLCRLQIVWFSTFPAMSAFYFQDIVGFLAFSWATTQALPSRDLVGDRPTSSLFSVYTISSVLGMWILNMGFMLLAMAWVTSHEDYVPFPSHLVLVTEWWKMSRNWEMTCAFFLNCFQQNWSAVVFSFGHLFRLAWYKNVVLLLLFLVCSGFLTFLLLSEPNTLTRSFHLVYEPVSEYEPWNQTEPCPPMPKSLRLQLFWLIVANLLTVALWEKVIVQGSVGKALRGRCRQLSKHITLRL